MASLAKRLSMRSSKRADDSLTTKLTDNDEPADLHEEGRALLDEIMKLDYKVRLMFSHTHHEKLVEKDEKKKIVKKLELALENSKKYSAEDEELGHEIHRQAAKLLCIVSGNEYLEDGKSKTLQQCINYGEMCGWDMLKDEPWRGLVVAKAAKCQYPQAKAAVDKNPNLSEAIQEAPNVQLRLSVAREGLQPPIKPKK